MEEWDETDVEFDDTDSVELHPLAKPLSSGLLCSFGIPSSLSIAIQCYSVAFHLSAHTATIHCVLLPFLLAVCTLLPGSLYIWLGDYWKSDEFIRYVVCPKCDSSLELSY